MCFSLSNTTILHVLRRWFENNHRRRVSRHEFGIATIAWDGIVTGTVIGNLAAFGNALSFAFFVVFMRRAGNIDLLPIVMCGATVAALIGASNLSSFTVSPHDLAVCLIWGGL